MLLLQYWWNKLYFTLEIIWMFDKNTSCGIVLILYHVAMPLKSQAEGWGQCLIFSYVLKLFFEKSKQDFFLTHLCYVICLLDVSPYKELLSNVRWDQLIEQFRAENLKLYQLSSQSAFSVVVQSGLSALKTPHCYRVSLPVPRFPPKEY